MSSEPQFEPSDNASLERQKLLRLALVCSVVGLFLYAVGWAEYLWLSLVISLGIGFTTRLQQDLDPKSQTANTVAFGLHCCRVVRCGNLGTYSGISSLSVVGR